MRKLDLLCAKSYTKYIFGQSRSICTAILCIFLKYWFFSIFKMIKPSECSLEIPFSRYLGIYVPVYQTFYECIALAQFPRGFANSMSHSYNGVCLPGVTEGAVGGEKTLNKAPVKSSPDTKDRLVWRYHGIYLGMKRGELFHNVSLQDKVVAACFDCIPKDSWHIKSIQGSKREPKSLRCYFM